MGYFLRGLFTIFLSGYFMCSEQGVSFGVVIRFYQFFFGGGSNVGTL